MTKKILTSDTKEEEIMARRLYHQSNVTLKRQKRGSRRSRGLTDDAEMVRDLQRDLRRLGYLRSGIDGKFGRGTEGAVKALQYDLLHNAGGCTQKAGDGDAPVSVLDYNKGRVVEVTGVLDQALADCIADMANDSNFPKLPFAENPKERNTKVRAAIESLPPQCVPIPLLLAILKQESGFRHFRVPGKGDEDTCIVVGLDTPKQEHIITSRGYGLGQYTLFHHPPRPEEVEDVMLNAEKNLQKAIQELRDKFDRFVNGSTSGTQADDRLKEFGDGPLRECKYPADDARYLRDCQQCAHKAGTLDIKMGETAFYEGARHTYEKTKYYKKKSYSDVPARQEFGCDWPYAMRRYNGSGVNSYHYQTCVLQHLLALSFDNVT